MKKKNEKSNSENSKPKLLGTEEPTIITKKPPNDRILDYKIEEENQD